jgi:hypothetical protein
MDTLTRDRLAASPRRRLHGGRNLTKAVVDLVEVDGRPIVLKDLAGRPWPVRCVLGPWQLDREARAYALLGRVRGVPRFLGRIDRRAIALDYVAGRDLGSLRRGDLPGAFFDDLDHLLAEVHAAGVAHGDLHRHDVLQGRDGRPYLVDFSTSLVAGPGAGPLRRFLFDQMCRADRRAAAKLRRRLLPGAGPDLPENPGLYRVGGVLRRIRDALRGRRTAR